MQFPPMEATSHITPQDVKKGDPTSLLSLANPFPVQTLFLSNIDQTVAFPVETVFFFRAQTTRAVFDRVRRAVSDVLLTDYYFLAGRLRFDPDGRRLELVCNNAGVAFVEAESRLLLEDLGDVSLPNASFQHLLLRTDAFGVGGLAETPVFTIQVTRFACGAFSIGFVTNHSVLDGRSATSMFANLAAICRGELFVHKIDPLLNDRTCIKARDPPQITHQHHEYMKLPVAAATTSSSSFTSSEKPTPPPSLLHLSGTHAARVFPFAPRTIAALKRKSATPRCSTFEALVSHIWRARTRAVFDDPGAASSVLFAVDVRSRVDPPLPDGFIGNAVVTAMATATVKEVVAEESLGFCVGKVREAIGKITDEYVRSAVDWLEVNRGVPAAGGGSFYVSAWWKLPFHELDFGYGRAAYGGPVVSGMDEFVLLLSDGGEEGGINVWMVLERKKMEKFAGHVYEI